MMTDDQIKQVFVGDIAQFAIAARTMTEMLIAGELTESYTTLFDSLREQYGLDTMIANLILARVLKGNTDVDH